jgi:putative ABC transport system permease protein
MITKFVSTSWQMALMALNYLRGRKLRTALTTLAIVFGVAIIFAVNLVLPSMQEGLQRTMNATAGNVDLRVNSITGESFAPEEPLRLVASVDGVQAVTGALRRQITVPREGAGNVGNPVQIELVGVDPATAENVRHYIISDGRFLQPGDINNAIVPAGATDFAPQFKVGATFSLATAGGLKRYTVIGFLAEKGNVAAPQIIVSLDDAQAAFNQPGLINTIDVAFKPGVDRDAVAANIKAALSSTILGQGYVVNSNNSQLDIFASIQIGYAMMNVMGLLALFLGAFLIFNTFRTVVLERRHDLAMLRAIGATRRQLTQMILIESLLQGLMGTLIGLVLGYLLVAGLSSGVNSFLAQYMPSVRIDITVRAGALLGPLALGLLTTLVAGYWPARSASRVSPMEGLRPTSAATLRRAARWGLIVGGVMMALAVILLVASPRTTAGGAILFLIGMVIAAPSLVVPVAQLFSPILTLWYAREGDLARSNMARQPGRVAITASTLMIGLATLIMIAAMVNSMGQFVTKITTDTFNSDLLILPPTIGIYTSILGADESLAARVQALPEVQTVAGLRYASSTANDQGLEVLGIDPQNYPHVSKLDFTQGTPEDAYNALTTGRNAIVSSLTAMTYKLDIGSDFVIQTPTGPQTYRIAAIANDVLTMKLTAMFISQANLKTDFHKSEDVLLMVNLKPGADKSAVLDDVQQILAADYPQFTANLTGQYRQSLIEYSNSAMVFFYALALLILLPAALGLLNTLTINILERTREIGIVRAIGGSKAQIQRIVTAEALLLGLFGASAGVLTGVAMSYGFIRAFAGIGWQMPYSFPLLAIIAAIIIGVLLALFAAILPARNAARLDILRALQFE